MAVPIGPNLVGPASIDSPSTSVNCLFPAKPLTAGPFSAIGIFVNKAPLLFYHDACLPDTVEGAGPLCTIPFTPRKLVSKKNTSVFFNKFRPLVAPGDVTIALSSERPIVGPIQHPTLYIAQKAK